MTIPSRGGAEDGRRLAEEGMGFGDDGAQGDTRRQRLGGQRRQGLGHGGPAERADPDVDGCAHEEMLRPRTFTVAGMAGGAPGSMVEVSRTREVVCWPAETSGASTCCEPVR